MFAMKQDSEKKTERKRFFLDHTSKEDYFLKFQKDGFDDVLLIYSTLTLQRLFSLFFFILSSQKVLSSRNHYPYFTYEKTEAQGDCDQRHTHSWGTRPQAGTQVTSTPALLPLLNPKLPHIRMGPENTVNAKPYWTYIVHSIQLTFIDSWLRTINRSEKVTGDGEKKFTDYWGRPLCK